jgi:hypothetical protein
MQFKFKNSSLIPLIWFLTSCGPGFPGGQPSYIGIGDRDVSTTHEYGLTILFISASISNESINLQFSLEYAPTLAMRSRVTPPFDDRFDHIEDISVNFHFEKFQWANDCLCIKAQTYSPVLTSETGSEIQLNNQSLLIGNPIILSEIEPNDLNIVIPLSLIDDLDPTGYGAERFGSQFTIESQLPGQFGITIEGIEYDMFMFPNLLEGN